MNKRFHIVIYGVFALALGACTNREQPKGQYTPDMAESAAYSTYEPIPKGVVPNNTEAQLPPEHTVSRGALPYPYPNTAEGYNAARDSLTNPLAKEVAQKPDLLTEGKALYDIYCALCHGVKGDGQGNLVTTEKISGVPAYKMRPITQGSIYHVMYYGRGTMGAFSYQLSEKERWEVVLYVEKLRNDALKP